MKSVICFGEALIDFLSIDNSDKNQIQHNEFRQYPGGAPANAAVAIAKLGGKSSFAGQVGLDAFGDFLQNSLNKYNVDTRFLSRHSSAKTALAFVFLDELGERSFSFYREQSADMLFKPEQIVDEWFTTASSLHFCSNTLTSEFITSSTQQVLLSARENKLLLSFDVNLRHNLWPETTVDVDRVNHFVEQVDLIKFSREEIEYLSRGNIDDYIKEYLDKGVSLVVITDGAKAIRYFSLSFNGTINPPKIDAVDTTAGGDAFIGALLFGLSKFSTPLSVLKQSEEVEKLIEFASSCGAHAVTKPGAFPALPEFNDVSKFWPYS